VTSAPDLIGASADPASKALTASRTSTNAHRSRVAMVRAVSTSSVATHANALQAIRVQTVNSISMSVPTNPVRTVVLATISSTRSNVPVHLVLKACCAKLTKMTVEVRRADTVARASIASAVMSAYVLLGSSAHSARVMSTNVCRAHAEDSVHRVVCSSLMITGAFVVKAGPGASVRRGCRTARLDRVKMEGRVLMIAILQDAAVCRYR